MPHGQEKSGNQEKLLKNDKSQEKSGKNGGFWKKSGKKNFKTSDFLSSTLPNLKGFKW